jgi:hypothetical protein
MIAMLVLMFTHEYLSSSVKLVILASLMLCVFVVLSRMMDIEARYVTWILPKALHIAIVVSIWIAITIVTIRQLSKTHGTEKIALILIGYFFSSGLLYKLFRNG